MAVGLVVSEVGDVAIPIGHGDEATFVVVTSTGDFHSLVIAHVGRIAKQPA